jgi:hypothetical protein
MGILHINENGLSKNDSTAPSYRAARPADRRRIPATVASSSASPVPPWPPDPGTARCWRSWAGRIAPGLPAVAEKVLLSALRAHTNAPYKTKSLWETRRAFNRPGRARTVHRPNPAAVLQRRRRVALPHLRAIRVNCHMRWRGAAA